jgi:MFS family permease
MLPVLALLAPVYLTFAVLMAGNGLLTTLIPLRATLEGFPPEAIGLIGASYFAGMLAGTFASPVVVQRAGYIRAFAAYAAIAGTATLGFAVVVDPIAWLCLRVAIGFCFAGLLTIVEAWINAKATNEVRGRVLTLSNVVNFTGSLTGQQVLRFGDPRSFTLFSAVAAFVLISLVPMALTKADPPPPSSKGRVDIAGVFRASPIGVIAMLLIGLVNASFWSLAPVYVERLGGGRALVSDFMTAMILGSAIGPYPIGRLADRFDRRKVIIVVSAAVAVIELALALVAPQGAALIGLAFVLGLGHPVLYPIVSAHTNDRAGRERMLVISSTLLFLYCVGGMIGPIAASSLMARFGDGWLFLWGAALHVLIAAFVAQRMTVRAAPPERVASAADAPGEAPKGLPGGRA